jgi:putative molybdopterin biosynthesis protein
LPERKIYRRLVSVDDVIPIIEGHRPLRPLGEIELPLEEAIGRVLSRNVYAKANYPPYTRALMDGYAVMSDDLAGAYEDRPKRLRLVGRLSAGESKAVSIGRGECVEVSTGAAVPHPADAVVPVEYTSTEGGYVVFYRSAARGENVDQAGSDFVEGEVAAWRGEVLTPPLASLLAALGVDRVHVYRPARVGILPTGNELRSPGEELEYGCLYDSNSYLVYGCAKIMGAEPKIYERALDDERDLEEKLWKAIEENDLVVTIGGTSAGLEDLTYKVLSKLDPGLVVHGVREKPGRPFAVAVHRDKIVLSLPGFPLSCLLTVNLYLLPILAKLQGLKGLRAQVRRREVVHAAQGGAGHKGLRPRHFGRARGAHDGLPLAEPQREHIGPELGGRIHRRARERRACTRRLRAEGLTEPALEALRGQRNWEPRSVAPARAERPRAEGKGAHPERR